jgi:UDP-N-acetylglucosamine--dolichyl-phosphate N-acetylglucosaminephosphotransferase
MAEIDYTTLAYIIGIAVSAGFATFIATRISISYLTKKGIMVQDMPKPGKKMIPRPGGPALMAGIVVGSLALYALIPMTEYLVLLLSIGIAFVVGFIDDRKVMKGWFKPAMLIIASLPLLAFVYDDGLSLPGYGTVAVPLLYGALIIATMPLIGNTANSLDVFNGIVTTSFIIAFVSVFIAYGLLGASEEGLIGIPIIACLLVFHHYHKLPSRIFPGDSGAITMGVAYIGFAVITGMEIIALIAIVPAILNSFIFLSSTKKIVEHRELKGKAVGLTEDYKLKANKEKAAVSLFRLMLTRGPVTEAQLGRDTYKLMGFSGFLAIAIAAASMTWLVIPVIGVAMVFFMLSSKHLLIYIMIALTIVGIMCVTYMVWLVSLVDDMFLQLGMITPILLLFVVSLVIMKRKMLKPLYEELKPDED